MPKGWAASTRSVRWLAAGIVAVALGLAIIWVLFVPAADWLAHHDVGSATGSLHETALDNARGRLLTLGAGLFAAGALVFTARNFTVSRRTLELTEQGQVTDRYTKAIEQMGSDKLDVRIGGIYALERVARDSGRDHPAVMEVLTAFIREHSREQWPPPDHPASQEQERSSRPDVQAAVTVVGRRDVERDIRRIDLARATLTRANLRGANLARADLTSANLSRANFTRADLYGAPGGLQIRQFRRAGNWTSALADLWLRTPALGRQRRTSVVPRCHRSPPAPRPCSEALAAHPSCPANRVHASIWLAQPVPARARTGRRGPCRWAGRRQRSSQLSSSRRSARSHPEAVATGRPHRASCARVNPLAEAQPAPAPVHPLGPVALEALGPHGIAERPRRVGVLALCGAPLLIGKHRPGRG